MWKYRDTDEQKRLVKFTIAKTMRLALEYPELAQEHFDSLCKVIPDNERITVSNYQHNLTSDAEGEEILTCEKSKAMQLYSHLLDLVENERISEHYSEWCDLEREYIALFGENVFAGYFGSKCLPDAREVNFATKKPQIAEPKFKHKIGDKVRIVNDISHNNKYKGDITEIVYIDESNPNAPYKVDIYDEEFGVGLWCQESDLEPYTAAEQPMTDSETEHTKDEFATRMQGKFTEQDFTEAKQRTESCMASIPQFELPKQIEAQINKAMESIKAESRKQFGDFGAANADITIPVYRQMMRLGALLVLSARYLESEQTDSDRGDYISMTKPTDPNKCTLFGREEADSK